MMRELPDAVREFFCFIGFKLSGNKMIYVVGGMTKRCCGDAGISNVEGNKEQR
ncbi:hypothetical protein P4E94_18395 [Pontiellaceae bacterium B12219]|nr:hypothetical protein [Pontiellaceae bacterium B12219]